MTAPKNHGFTLIELMVVIAIIAILVSIAIGSYSVLQKGGRDAKRKSDLATIQSALEQYHADQNYYPNVITFGNKLAYGTKTYLAKIPQDSLYNYITQPLGCTDKCINYCLYANLENSFDRSSSCTDDASRNYEVTAP